MSQLEEALKFYSDHGVITDPRDQALLLADLPSAIPDLCKVVQGLLIHPLVTQLYKVDLTAIQRKEVNLRSTAEMLRLAYRLDPRPIIEARPAKDRVVGNCRDHALLLCAFLRHQHRPARVRSGFAHYLDADRVADHWITEYWEPSTRQWVRVDPQIDETQRQHLKITFDPGNLPTDQFETAAQAWVLCRSGKAKSGKYGFNRKLRGWNFMRGKLLLELAALNKFELLATDGWWHFNHKKDEDLTPEERKLLDDIAAAIMQVEDHFTDLRAIYENNELLSGPVQSKLRLLGILGEPLHKNHTPLSETSDDSIRSALALRPSDHERLSAMSRQALPLPLEHAGTSLATLVVNQNADPDVIVVRGAQQHNLKQLNVTIPRNKLVVLTGVSGSGKSSLAFDTLYAEGQRRYVESLSAYVRRYLDQMDKPKVDYIGGLSPAIAIEQKSISKNPRSTVGTVTEVMDYLRVLFSRAGTQHCPQCGRAIEPTSPQQIASGLRQLPPGSRIQLLAPLVHNRKGDHSLVLETAGKDGFSRVRIDGSVVELLEGGKFPRITKSQLHCIELVVDRLIVPSAKADKVEFKDFAGRLIDSVETALKYGKGTLLVILGEGDELLLSELNACPHCDISLPELTPGLFSFNSPAGMCPDCNGLGTRLEIDQNLVIEHPEQPLIYGASRWFGDIRKKKSWQFRHLTAIGEHYHVDLEVPWKDLPEHFQNVILNGSGSEKITFSFENSEGTWKGESNQPVQGVIHNISRLFRQTKSEYTRRFYMSFMSQQPCPACGGSRLCVEARNVTVGGSKFTDLLDMTIAQAYDWVCDLSNGGSQHKHLSAEHKEVVGELLKEIRSRLLFMLNVGLHYLTLSRPAPTLSGGEGQRIRLASQLGCGLVGVLYILDEPSIGLHARDQRNLLNTLLQLRDMGNTVLVVEHDAETMLAADYLIDLGPGAGVLGGELIAAGTPAEVCANPASLTGRYLSGDLQVSAPDGHQRRTARGWLTLTGARLFNLKNVTATIPLGAITCITGVSGSGKSSLISETLYPALARALMGAQSTPGPYDRLDGLNQLDKVIDITQDPIGRTPRSNPATYVGIFDEIRKVYAATPEARMRGYQSDRFSFNVKGGRCEACQGHGLKRIEMHFLPDVWVTCQECKGARYNRHTLEINYKGKNIADVLNMDVQQALDFFGAFPGIARMLQTLHDVGLDYVKLGQSATTLSGGEAQRVKLAKELGRVATGDTLYILDEPTTGLHFADIQRLLDVLHRLADAGNTVIIIEHNLDVIKTADWLIDMGPEGGAGGGSIVAEGTPEQVAQNVNSFTGQFLSKSLI